MIVVSAVFGAYDTVKRCPPCPSHLFTDGSLEFCSKAESLGWNVIHRLKNEAMDGRYQAKAVKATPHLVLAGRCFDPHVGLILEAEDVDILWVDGGVEVREDVTLQDLQKLVYQVPKGGVGSFPHRLRTTFQEEAQASLPSLHFKRYENQSIAAQDFFYRDRYHLPNQPEAFPPELCELWETGVVVWRGAERTMGVRWAAEMLAWTNQDQISFPVAAYATATRVTTLRPGSSVDNPWFQFVGHQKNGVRD